MTQDIKKVDAIEQEDEETSLVISIGDPEHSTYLDLADTKPRSTTAHMLTGATIGVLTGIAGLALAKSGKLPFQVPSKLPFNVSIPNTNLTDAQKSGCAFVTATTALGAIITGLHSHRHNSWAKRVLAEMKEAQQAEKEMAV